MSGGSECSGRVRPTSTVWRIHFWSTNPTCYHIEHKHAGLYLIKAQWLAPAFPGDVSPSGLSGYDNTCRHPSNKILKSNNTFPMTIVMGDKWPSLTSQIASRDNNDDRWCLLDWTYWTKAVGSWVANGDLYDIFFFIHLWLLLDCPCQNCEMLPTLWFVAWKDNQKERKKYYYLIFLLQYEMH